MHHIHKNLTHETYSIIYFASSYTIFIRMQFIQLNRTKPCYKLIMIYLKQLTGYMFKRVCTLCDRILKQRPLYCNAREMCKKQHWAYASVGNLACIFEHCGHQISRMLLNQWNFDNCNFCFKIDNWNRNQLQQ